MKEKIRLKLDEIASDLRYDILFLKQIVMIVHEGQVQWESDNQMVH